ncbi:MAG: hypothetical protein GY928_39025 [Colwellia sp.]|nr:hypothetical protein [Colwellia sp.]
MAILYLADISKLENAIDSTGVSASVIAVSGKLSRDTLNNARNGKRISKPKANGIVNGLNINGCNPKVELLDIFGELTK